MQLISVTNDPYQQQNVVLPDGTLFLLQLYFRPLQYGWFINEISWGDDFKIYGLRITNSPDMLYQWRNKIPFGLACYSTALREPSQLDDFASEASKLYLLSADEVEAYKEFLTSGS